MEQKTILMAVGAFVIGLIVLYFMYNSEPFTQMNGLEKKGKLIFYHADWCGHCQNFKPEWDKIKQQYGNVLDFADYEHKQIPKETLKNLYAFPTIYYDDYAQKKLVEINGVHDLTKLIE